MVQLRCRLRSSEATVVPSRDKQTTGPGNSEGASAKARSDCSDIRKKRRKLLTFSHLIARCPPSLHSFIHWLQCIACPFISFNSSFPEHVTLPALITYLSSPRLQQIFKRQDSYPVVFALLGPETFITNFVSNMSGKFLDVFVVRWRIFISGLIAKQRTI